MINFNPKDYIVRWQSDLENTKENKLPVCDKPYQNISEDQRKSTTLGGAWKFA